jgi:lipopolysaccharide transport system ATP-binding protein
MREVSRSEGRTVLFVSHNMDAIRRLCPRCVLLDGGRVMADGATESVVTQYLHAGATRVAPRQWIGLSQSHHSGTGEARFVAVQFGSPSPELGFHPYSDGPLDFLLAIESDSERSTGSVAVSLHDLAGTRLVNADTLLIDRTVHLAPGRNLLRLRIEQVHLNAGIYTVALWLANPRGARSARGVYDFIEAAFEIELLAHPTAPSSLNPHAAVACQFEFLEVDLADVDVEEAGLSQSPASRPNLGITGAAPTAGKPAPDTSSAVQGEWT